LIKNRVLDPPVKLPITYGSHLQTKDPRYGVSTTFDSTTLTIKQLKVSDCGSYTCEASFANGTVISSSDLMIFLCF
jgi:Immunoglobulin I-set domain